MTVLRIACITSSFCNLFGICQMNHQQFLCVCDERVMSLGSVNTSRSKHFLIHRQRWASPELVSKSAVPPLPEGMRCDPRIHAPGWVTEPILPAARWWRDTQRRPSSVGLTAGLCRTSGSQGAKPRAQITWHTRIVVGEMSRAV